MYGQNFGETYGQDPAENYERFFVPAVSEPLAKDLIRHAALRPGERVLDVGCGTGIVARLAAQEVGSTGTVAGLDPNPGMLVMARSVARRPIQWHQASAESIPSPAEAFDVVLCQMSLQFMPDRRSSLQEMRRVLVHGGRLALNVPGSAGEMFASLAKAMEHQISADAAAFVRQIFSLHNSAELQQLVTEAGFDDTDVLEDSMTLPLPPAREFLWQYVQSTPLAAMMAQTDEKTRGELEREVLSNWQNFEEAGVMRHQQRVLTAIARKK
jgi:ubiquinone/menaquinone biosynthesis C-methylase UbiE